MKETPRDEQTTGSGESADIPVDDRNLVVLSAPDELPPVLDGHLTHGSAPVPKASMAALLRCSSAGSPVGPVPIPSAPTAATS